MLSRSGRNEGFGKLEEEIRKEKAEALGRAGERIEEALMAVYELRQIILALGRQIVNGTDSADSWDTASIRQEFDRRIAEYNRLRERAQTFYHYLLVQREAVGFRGHADVERQYVLPDRVEADQVLRDLRPDPPSSSPDEGRGDRSS